MPDCNVLLDRFPNLLFFLLVVRKFIILSFLCLLLLLRLRFYIPHKYRQLTHSFSYTLLMMFFFCQVLFVKLLPPNMFSLVFIQFVLLCILRYKVLSMFLFPVSALSSGLTSVKRFIKY